MVKKRKTTKKTTKKETGSFKPRKIKIKVVGLGGGGASIVSEMAQTLKNVSFLVADTDGRVFKKVQRGVKIFQFGEKLAGGMGTGMDPELARKAALGEKEKIAKIFQAQDLLIMIGALGGGVASGAGPVFAEMAASACRAGGSHPEGGQRPTEGSRSKTGGSFGASRLRTTGKPVTLGIFTLPFNFEGEKKMKVAKRALEKLRENLSGIIVVPNEKIFQLIDKRTPLKKALSTLNQTFASWLNELILVISKPNLINIDFADVRTILGERGRFIFFGQGMSQGPNRVEEVIKNIFQNPLFEGQPKGVKRILFNITGGKDLKLKEVESISKAIAELNPRAKIIFGVSETPEYNGKIKLTLLAVSDHEKGEGRKKKAREAAAGKPATVKKTSSAKKKPASAKTTVVKKIIPVSSESNSSQQRRTNKPARKASPARKAPLSDAGRLNDAGGRSNAGREKIRRSALEVKKAEQEAQEREWASEGEWDVPTFLRDKIK